MLLVRVSSIQAKDRTKLCITQRLHLSQQRLFAAQLFPGRVGKRVSSGLGEFDPCLLFPWSLGRAAGTSSSPSQMGHASHVFQIWTDEEPGTSQILECVLIASQNHHHQAGCSALLPRMYQQAVQHLLLTTIFQDAQSSLKSPQLHLQATQLADQEITACLSGRAASLLLG